MLYHCLRQPDYRVFGCRLFEDSFSVRIETDKMVEDLKDEIIRKAKLTSMILPDQLKLFKVNYCRPIDF